MVFSSLVFVFAFLALHLVVYTLVDERYKNPVLLASSLIFYAWGGPRYVLLLAGETLVSWAAALAMDQTDRRPLRRAILALDCLVLLGLLGYFKYAGFVVSNINALTGAGWDVPSVVLPIGISFYTFQLISYAADVCAGRVEAQRTYWKLLLYSSLFHQCIAGPIVRYETVAAQIEDRSPTWADIYQGTRRFCVGLAKKTLLANACAAQADALVPTGSIEALSLQPTAGVWLGMVFYMLQIYLDFSAYSDMAIGLGRMIGFHYLENFDHPYEASSIQDFWRRWHISLSSFFRDYVYIPLGGSRAGTGRLVFNLAAVWFLTGLWHGASWNYVFWGLYYFAFLLLERFVIQGRMPRVASHVYALVVVLVGWLLFRFEGAGELAVATRSFFGFSEGGWWSLAVGTAFMQNIFLLAVSIVACTHLGSFLRRVLAAWSQTGSALGAFVYRVSEAVVPPVLLVLSIVAMAGASYNPFIYFQF